MTAMSARLRVLHRRTIAFLLAFAVAATLFVGVGLPSLTEPAEGHNISYCGHGRTSGFYRDYYAGQDNSLGYHRHLYGHYSWYGAWLQGHSWRRCRH